jgi:hypothetical protein
MMRHAEAWQHKQKIGEQLRGTSSHKDRCVVVISTSRRRHI